MRWIGRQTGALRCFHSLLESTKLHSRPATIGFDPSLANTATLTGKVIGNPAVYKVFSGKIAKAVLLVEDKSCFFVDFHNGLGDCFIQHVRRGDWIQVSGSVSVEMQRSTPIAKIRVRDFQLVEGDVPGRSEEQDEHSRLWQNFFAAPHDYWDNRHDKENSKRPDFRHKSTKEALWLDDSRNPPWVYAQVEMLESRGLLRKPKLTIV